MGVREKSDNQKKSCKHLSEKRKLKLDGEVQHPDRERFLKYGRRVATSGGREKSDIWRCVATIGRREKSYIWKVNTNIRRE